MSQYSSVAIVTATVLYLIAMIAHAAEWGFARGSTRTAVRRARVPVAVGAEGAGGVDGFSDPDETFRTVSDGRRGARIELFGRLGVTLTVMALVLALLGVVLRGVAAQRAPWGNMYEFMITAMVLVVAAYLVCVKLWGMRWLGLPVTMLAAVGNGLAITVFYVAVAPLVPALHSVWFLIHIIAGATAGAAMNVGGIASILYLIKDRSERREDTKGYLATRLPAARTLDAVAYRFNAFAFPVWTFAVAAGAVWAEYAWGRFWGWDPKETWALVTWVIYACYLHARATAGWRGKAAAAIAIIGMVSFWFNFVGVNLLFSGLHSYAGI